MVNELKEIVVGGIGILSGVILFGLILVAAAIYAPYQASTEGFSSQLGVYISTLRTIGLFPLVISAGLFVSGIYFLIKEMKN